MMKQERPDGSIATMIGWGLIALGVLAAFFVTSAETETGFWFAIALSNLGVGLGVLLVSLGYLVKAIWFLPGRRVARSEIIVEEGSDRTACEWCLELITLPAKPCSSFSPEKLAQMAGQISNNTCLFEIGQRGHFG